MSRRSRRSRRRNPGGTGGGGLAKLAAWGIALVLLLAAGFYAGVRHYLHSEAFRHLLSAQVSSAAGVSGEFTPLRWDGLAVDADGFSAQGEALVSSMKVDGIHTEVGLGGFGRGVWELRDSRARRLQISVDARRAGEGMPESLPQPSGAPSEGKSRSRWLPREVELQALELQEISLDVLTKDGEFTAHGIRMDVEKAAGPRSHRIALEGGTLRMPYRLMPEIQLASARILAQPDAVFLSHLEAAAWSAARIQASGEWDGRLRSMAIDGKVSGVKCEEVFNDDWARRLTGGLSSDFVFRRDGSGVSAEGHLVLQQGVLTALPVLDVLAAYADTRRFRTLVLSDAQTDWRWRGGVLEFYNIVLGSESLVRLEGRLAIYPGGQLDGDLRLGLAPGTLATIPGAETLVFMPGERGLLWAPLRVTGTLEKPREDLSDRLMTAAGLRLLETLPETGEKVLKFSRTVLGEDSRKAVEKGVKIIEEGSKTVREVSGILDSILGGGRRDEPEEAPPVQPAEP